MNYNILYIDKKLPFSNQEQDTLELLINSNVHIENEIDKVRSLLEYKEIHLIIINTNIISINSLNTLFEELSINSGELPILIVGDDISDFKGLSKVQPTLHCLFSN